MTFFNIFVSPVRGKTKACGASGCDRIIDGLDRYCTNHTCQWARCRKFAGTFGGCVKHSCVKCNQKWHSGKPKLRRGVKYCEAHLCRVEDCKSEKEHTQAYCVIHTCSKEGCVEVAEHWRGLRGVCQSHCEVLKCDGVPLKHHRCARHICNWPSCCQIMDGVANTRFCYLHVCISPNCSAVRQDVVMREVYHPYCSACVPLPKHNQIPGDSSQTTATPSVRAGKPREASATATAESSSTVVSSVSTSASPHPHATDKHFGELTLCSCSPPAQTSSAVGLCQRVSHSIPPAPGPARRGEYTPDTETAADEEGEGLELRRFPRFLICGAGR